MTCPRCSVAEISPASGACELCGFVPDGNVAVDIPQPDATDAMARQQLAHEFRLDVLLGHGDRSAVYLAREGNSSQYVVLKVLPRLQDRDPQADDRFRRAAELVSTLDHPHIVPVNRYGTTDSLFWYTMDHVRARSLREILRSRGPLELKTCQRVVAQIASALDYAHRRGVVHGDIKPENVLIDPNGWVHICDALVTRELERPSSPRGSRPAPRPSTGTPRATQATARSMPPRTTPPEPHLPADTPRRPDYQAPEDLRSGQRTSYADQYALAVLVHECLTGSVPSAGADAFEPPATLGSLRPDLPAHVTHAVTRALSPKPGDRFPAILDFALALETGVLALTDSRPTGRGSDMVLTVPDWEPPPGRRPKWLFPLLAVLLTGGAALIGWPKYQRWRLERSWEQELPQTVSSRVAPDSATLRAMADSMNRSATALPPGSLTTQPPAGSLSTNPRPVADNGGDRPTSRRQGNSSGSTPSRTGEDRSSRRRDRSSASAPPAAAPAAATGEAGHLFVNASPWGQLFIDGQPVGNTPRANLAVPAGTHTLRVVRDGFEPFERQVQVAPGETVRVTDIVLTPRP